MKRVLIISPHFPPVNAADMQRIRHSLPYFYENGWQAEVIAVDPKFIEVYSMDPLLAETIPSDIPVHWVDALAAEKTRRYGLGSLSMRAWFSIRKKGNELLKHQAFDLVYFSTTAFHVMRLGPYWKRKFGIPFVLDIQDPWRNDFYLDKPARERPPKFWFSYTLDKLLEKATIPHADGIISVSEGYLETFRQRYPKLKALCRVIPFGASLMDQQIMEQRVHNSAIRFDPQKINLLYIGRGGHDLRFALSILFGAIREGIRQQQSGFDRIHCWFIGTSYAAPGKGQATIKPVAADFGIDQQVTEITDRQPFFETLYLLKQAHFLIVPGSTDTHYTASKIYPYLLSGKPLIALFHQNSSVLEVLQNTGIGYAIAFNHELHEAADYQSILIKQLSELIHYPSASVIDSGKLAPYLAPQKTKDQTQFFEEVLKRFRSAKQH